jgi:hypothetical protein
LRQFVDSGCGGGNDGEGLRGEPGRRGVRALLVAMHTTGTIIIA